MSSIRLTSFQRKPYRRTSDDLFVLDCSRKACARSPPGPALIRPVNRMDGLARTSLKPIRCTERETAFPSSVMLYVTMAGREYRAALYPMHACILLFLCALSHVQPTPSFLSSPVVSFSAMCLHSVKSHALLSCCPVAGCRWVTFSATANKRQNSPSGIIRNSAAESQLLFIITQNSLAFHH